MLVEKRHVIEWLEREFKAKKSKSNEYSLCCPFCDKERKHNDYMFNVDKMLGHCWRGFETECESGHNLTTFVALYYGISISQANEYIDGHFEVKDRLTRIKHHIEVEQKDRLVDISNEKIIWELPREAIKLLSSNEKEATKALYWLAHTRSIPLDLIEVLDPRLLVSSREQRWKNYVGRVFFPVTSNGHRAWIAYSTKKKSTKDFPKTRNPPGAILSYMLYLYDFYKNSNKPVVICEGIFDALRVFIFGYNAVCLFGTNVSAAQIELLNLLPIREVVLCLDADATEYKLGKDGRWSSKALKIGRVLKEYYIGDVSIMRLAENDPDKQRYNDFKKFYDNREPISRLVPILKRLRANVSL